MKLTIYKYKIVDGHKVARVYQKFELLSFNEYRQKINEAKSVLGNIYAGSILKRKI